jgi:hypothetical protein
VTGSNVFVSADSRLALAPQISLQALGLDEGGVVLKLDSGELYTINDTTLAFLQALDGRRSITEVAQALTETFDVDHATLTGDLVAIAGDLMSEKLVAAT